jgi:hypothetical protein
VLEQAELHAGELGWGGESFEPINSIS